jgi:hypothetical protein
MTDDADLDRGPTFEDRTLAERLEVTRPVPGAGFRGALGRHLVASDPGYGTRPARLRLFTAVWIFAGALLLAVGSLQATGAL